MLLIVFILVVKVIFLSCTFGNKNEVNLFNEINRQRKIFGLSKVEIYLTLQLAAEKRCNNQEELIESYQKMISNTYNDDDWPKQEQLDQIFSYVYERIYLYGLDIRNDIFQAAFPYRNRKNRIYVGIALHEHKNFSAKCILYGELNKSISNHRRIIRLLYILIGCGILLLSLIVCSIMHDQRQIKLKEQLEQEISDKRNTIIQKKSAVGFVDNDRRSTAQRADMNRITTTRINSIIDQRPSAIHSFFSKS